MSELPQTAPSVDALERVEEPPTRPGRLSVASWVTYDLSNTIFSLVVVSLEFPLWVLAAGGNDFMLGMTTGLSMLAVALLAPVLGAVSDSAPKRMPFLVASTVGCVLATALLGRTALVPALFLFAVANGLYNMGLVFYDSLLPDVSTPATRGRIGGLGVAVGYLGSVVGIAASALIASRVTGDPRPTIFLATAGLFLLLSVPCFLFVKERPRLRRPRVPIIQGIRATVRDTARYAGLRRFLVGRVFFADAANTLIVFMGVYVRHEIGFTDETVRLVLLFGIVGAVAGGWAIGSVVDRVGPKRTLYGVMTLWLGVFAVTVAIPTLDLPEGIFWGVAPVAGFALGGTWASDRPFMLRLTPPARVGEFYGLYAMAGRFAAIMGPILWGVIVDGLGWGRPAAVASLGGMMLVAMWVLRKVDDSPETGPLR